MGNYEHHELERLHRRGSDHRRCQDLRLPRLQDNGNHWRDQRYLRSFPPEHSYACRPYPDYQRCWTRLGRELRQDEDSRSIGPSSSFLGGSRKSLMHVLSTKNVMSSFVVRCRPHPPFPRQSTVDTSSGPDQWVLASFGCPQKLPKCDLLLASGTRNPHLIERQQCMQSPQSVATCGMNVIHWVELHINGTELLELVALLVQ